MGGMQSLRPGRKATWSLPFKSDTSHDLVATWSPPLKVTG